MQTDIALAQAEEMARVETQRILGDYEVPSELMGQVVLTTLFEGDDRVFVLYVPGKTRNDPIVVSRTKLNIKTGDLYVEVPSFAKKVA